MVGVRGTQVSDPPVSYSADLCIYSQGGLQTSFLNVDLLDVIVTSCKSRQL